MAKLELYLLGSTQVKLDEEYIEVKPRKALALLVYLAVSAERHARDALATLLWPESSQQSARKSLRGRLSELNMTLGEEWIEADRENLVLRDGYWLDVAAFQDALADNDADAQALMKAADLYRDDFMTGFTLPDCPEFDDWQFFQAESQRQSLANALDKLIQLLAEQEEYETAIPYGRRWLGLDSLHEPAHRALMRLYAQSGQQASALRQYDQSRQTLEKELGISPSQETRALYQEIQAGKFERREQGPRPRHNLPVQTSTFIGRESEIGDIKRLLLEEPGCRLLNLVGPGGTGKTRLALATGAQLLDDFPDGVFFVSLAPVGETEDIVPTIAKALSFTFYGSEDPKTQLLEHLARKEMLLVVDNFEHLMAGANLLSQIMNHAPDVTLLVTSRERLNLAEEWGYDVHGLPFPVELTAGQAEVELIEKYSSLELFLLRARRANARFSPSAQEMADIIRICQAVDGTPLGIELAAPWVRAMSCREIADEIESNLDFLISSLRNIPERHRSLRAVFEQSWERLSEQEQAVLQRLSVFRGGCTREAAEQVTGATLPILVSLVDKALLHRNNLGRYELHELIRQFAEDQLKTEIGAYYQAQRQHQNFYVSFLEKREAGLKGAGQKQAISEVKADVDNVRLAWRRAVADRDAEAINKTAECLFLYFLYSSGHYEAQITFAQGVSAFANVSDALKDDDLSAGTTTLDRHENLVGFLLVGQGYFLSRTHDAQAGQALLESALKLLRRAEPRDRRREGLAQMWLGWAFYFQGRFIEAQERAVASLSLLSEINDHQGEIWSLLLWANCAEEGHPLEAEQALNRARIVCQRVGEQYSLGYIFHNLGDVAITLGLYTKAKQHIEQAISISEALENTLGLAYALREQAKLAIAQGKYRQAIQLLQQATSYFEEVRTQANVNFCHQLLGTAYRLSGDYHQAEQFYRLSLQASQAVNDHKNGALCLMGLGCLAYDRDDLPLAEKHQREALDVWQGLEQEARIADVLRYLGDVMMAHGQRRHAEASQFFRQSLELAINHQLAPIALHVCVSVASLLAPSNRMERAVQLLVLAEQHEATTFETRERAGQLLAALQERPQTGEIAKAQAEGMVDVWDVAAGVLVDLEDLEASHTSGSPTGI